MAEEVRQVSQTQSPKMAFVSCRSSVKINLRQFKILLHGLIDRNWALNGHKRFHFHLMVGCWCWWQEKTRRIF
ncbi:MULTISPECIES: hypothetical protein [unclassified Rhizobium]|uniref:hypothetical protein n=1 Tax=unclassified Rhizobium TaxID=2613769 RepID=UPI0012E28F83|nr:MULTISPECIES: hypothetical protein [unclassified Rhizobium]